MNNAERLRRKRERDRAYRRRVRSKEKSDPVVANHELRKELLNLKRERTALIERLSTQGKQLEIASSLRNGLQSLKPVTARKKVGGKQRQGVPVMLCSDWHVEELVRPETVNGVNEYNLDIANRCIERMGEAYEWLIRDSRYDIREGIVWLGGDLFSGHIHEELAENSLLSPTNSILWLQKRIVKMLKYIEANCQTLDRIIVLCNDGNHGRMTHKIRVNSRTDQSLETLLYRNIAEWFADNTKFEFHIAESEWLVYDKLYKEKLVFTHGDSFKFGGGIGGITIPINKAVAKMRTYDALRDATQICMGHFHQRIDLGGVNINGSMIGATPYSMRIHAPYEKRQQSWFLIDSERGKCMSAPIWLDE